MHKTIINKFISALKDVLRNDYILNGLWFMTGPGEYDGAGTKFFYHQSDSYCPGDCLNARGPILSQVLVQVNSKSYIVDESLSLFL